MLRLVYKSCIIIICLTVISPAYSGNRDVEKRKVVERNYTVDEDVLLSIENRFGKVHINTWDKNEMDIRVEVIARRRTESRAQELLDKIEIKIDESSSTKRFVTDLQGSINNKNSESYEINYTINMPSNNPLELKNSFGDAYIGDISGDVNLKISYGDIQTKNLTGKSDIKLSFGDGEFESISTGEIDVKYSDMDVQKLGVVRIEQGFSDLKITEAESIDLRSKYGDVEIGSIKGIRGYVGFSDFSIDKLWYEMDMETSYAGGFEVEEVSKEFKKVIVEGKFGSFTFGFEEGTNGRFEAKLKFCDFKYYGDELDIHYRVKEDFRSEYRGKFGNGEGGEVRIVSSYGDVKFR